MIDPDDLDQTIQPTHAVLQTQTARRITQILDAATAEPTRSQIILAIRAYERDVLHQVTWQA